MAKLATIARRTFLVGSAAVVGGVAFGVYKVRQAAPNPLLDGLPQGATALTPYVRIDGQGVTLIAPRAEMGQGIHTTLAALVAEELDVAWDSNRVEHGAPDRHHPLAVTVGVTPPDGPGVEPAVAFDIADELARRHGGRAADRGSRMRREGEIERGGGAVAQAARDRCAEMPQLLGARQRRPVRDVEVGAQRFEYGAQRTDDVRVLGEILGGLRETLGGVGVEVICGFKDRKDVLDQRRAPRGPLEEAPLTVLVRAVQLRARERGVQPAQEILMSHVHLRRDVRRPAVSPEGALGDEEADDDPAVEV
jgi:hypothetical protein